MKPLKSSSPPSPAPPLLPLNQRHRRDIAPPRPSPIIRPRRHNHKRKDNHRPIHPLGPRRRRLGEKRQHETERQKRQRDIIDQSAPPAQRPAAREQLLAAETLEADGADGEDVGEEEGGVGEGDDGVEGDVGAEVEGGDEEGDEQDDEEGVDGDVAGWMDLGWR